MYVKVKIKFVLSLLVSFAWIAVATYLAIPWFYDIAAQLGSVLAVIIILTLAIIPGWAMSFVISSLCFDKRPNYKEKVFNAPPLTLLIAAYNEENNIIDTLSSISSQEYNSHLRVIIIDDGSTDKTAEKASEFINNHFSESKTFELVKHEKNQGKAQALQTGLNLTETKYIITMDGDSYLLKNSVDNLVRNIVFGPPMTAAVAGSVLVRNSRKNLITRLQEWDYFHGIATIKRVQSLYQGTMVAQGSFSVYRTDFVRRVGGWPSKIGEDIVLTWGLREKGDRISYAENAFCFTHVPETYKQFFRQRKRWARGLIEAFKKYPRSLTQLKMTLPFIWYNLCFPLVDSSYLLFFIPGIVLALLFKCYLLVGLMTILLLPLAVIANIIFFYKQKKIFKKYGLKVRRNVFGFLFYMLIYQTLMAPATVAGYLSEVLNLTKKWGTK
jgi:biofilm PGA synthesis N-glycosyltransferase PgaC